MAGKGDKPRPHSIPLEEFGEKFDRIFKKKNKGDSKNRSTKENKKTKNSG